MTLVVDIEQLLRLDNAKKEKTQTQQLRELRQTVSETEQDIQVLEQCHQVLFNELQNESSNQEYLTTAIA